MRRRPSNVLASLFTTLSLYCGVFSIFTSIAGQAERAVYLILLALVFDTLDGSVARLTKSVSEFGKELDSLCDLVAFGVAPAVLMVTTVGPQDAATGGAPGRLNAVLAILFVICGALRLARFNVYQSEERQIFTGLPIPAAGGTMATFVLWARHLQLEGSIWLLEPLALGLSYLMVSSIRYPKDKLKLFVLAPQHAFRTLAVCGATIALFHYAWTRSPAIVLFPVGMAYVLFGILYELVTFLGGKRVLPGGEPRNKPHERSPSSEGEKTSAKIAERL